MRNMIPVLVLLLSSCGEGRDRGDGFRASLEMVTLCQDLARAKAKYPSSADFGLRIESLVFQGERIVDGDVEMMNDFGAMIPHGYRCIFDESGNLINVMVQTK